MTIDADRVREAERVGVRLDVDLCVRVNVARSADRVRLPMLLDTDALLEAVVPSLVDIVELFRRLRDTLRLTEQDAVAVPVTTRVTEPRPVPVSVVSLLRVVVALPTVAVSVSMAEAVPLWELL